MYHMKYASALTFQNARQPLLVAAADALAHEYRERHKTDLGTNSQQVLSIVTLYSNYTRALTFEKERLPKASNHTVVLQSNSEKRQ